MFDLKPDNCPDHKQPPGKNWVIALTLVLLVMMAAMIFYPFTVFWICTLLIAGLVVYLVVDRPARGKAAEESFAAQVRRRLDHCQAQEDQFRDEAERVRMSIRALRDDLEGAPAEWTTEQEQAKTTIAELQAEFNLRHVKALFFADCATRLKEMLDRYHLRRSIQARREELRQLRRTNHDTEAEMEETRYHLERDAAQLDAITEMSREVATDFHAERAEELRARLETLRQKLSVQPKPSSSEKS